MSMRIKNIPVVNRKNATFSLDENVLDKLKEYCNLYQIKNGQEVTEALMLEAIVNRTIDGDKAFRNHLAAKEKQAVRETGNF